MFAVIYRWKLREEVSEGEFTRHWHDETQKIYLTYGSLGSCLHKVEDGTFLAYAKWPSRDNWENMMRQKEESNGEHATLIDGPICLETIDDLLRDTVHKI
ncbi:MAG: hypothetical protein Q8Q42_02945 [Nanoarchaeota archaeon]|nr:hypothetical protein [Nanoarchaeota archaeon]